MSPTATTARTSGPSRGTEEPQRGNRAVRALQYGFFTLPEDIGKSLLFGLVLAAAITALVPQGYFAEYVPQGILQMLVMMAVGIPMYVCATASVPIAYSLWAQAGVSPGAALVFLMTGPATNAATLAIIWRVLGRRTAIVYLLVVAGDGLGIGAAAGRSFCLTTGGWAGRSPMQMLPGWLKNVAAVVLLAVLGVALIWPRLRQAKPLEVEEAMITRFKIGGMTCSHCAESVRQAIVQCKGVESVRVDLKAGLAEAAGEKLDVKCVIDAVKARGYDAQPIEQA